MLALGTRVALQFLAVVVAVGLQTNEHAERTTLGLDIVQPLLFLAAKSSERSKSWWGAS
jgi:hypothetical protein